MPETADLFESLFVLETLLESDDVDRFAGIVHHKERFKNGLMDRFKKMLGLKEVRNPIESIVVDEDRAQEALFGLDIMRCAAKSRSSRVGREFQYVRIEWGHEG